ncbi:MAG: hypothetical protein ACRBCT_02705 [Alphaproteobacteria bacterium]
MSLEYVERKIVEALKLHNGNTARTREQLIAWAIEDQQLLLGLTKSHLSGIAAYNIERVVSGRAAKARAQAKPKAPAKQRQPAGNDFGVELLKAVASTSSEVFGLENNTPLGGRARVSQGHINAINSIASRKETKS